MRPNDQQLDNKNSDHLITCVSSLSSMNWGDFFRLCKLYDFIYKMKAYIALYCQSRLNSRVIGSTRLVFSIDPI